MGFFDIFRRKPRIKSEELAQRLFSSLVLDDEATMMASERERLKAALGFQIQAFERQKFVYLAANITIALTNDVGRHSAVAEVIPHFRRLVAAEMRKRWGDSDDAIDSEMERAASDYTTLLFTNPDQNKGLSFDWSKEWLRRIGVEEFNPAVLFSVSAAWKMQYVHTAELLSRVRVLSLWR